MQNQLTEAARKLSIPDRITLDKEIWDTIAENNQPFELTDAQKRELVRRLESAKTNPGQGRSWKKRPRTQLNRLEKEKQHESDI